MTVSGIVVDESGAPVPDATVRMGSSPIPGAIESPISGARSGISQAGGSFSIGGCQPGKQWVSATAPGFAQLLGEADLQENADLVRLVLHRGKLLSLQFVDNQGNPIPQVMVDVGGWEEHHSGWISVPTPSFQTADQEGRVKWSNAPDADVRFSVFCYKWAGGNPSESKDNIRMTAADGSGAVVRDLKDGMTVRPNGEEQVIVLERALFAGGMSQDTNHSERQK